MSWRYKWESNFSCSDSRNFLGVEWVSIRVETFFSLWKEKVSTISSIHWRWESENPILHELHTERYQSVLWQNFRGVEVFNSSIHCRFRDVLRPNCLFSVLWQNFRSFSSLKERYQSVPPSIRICKTFSRLRRRLSSLVRLTARWPWGCWACSALSLKASLVPERRRKTHKCHQDDELLRKFQIDVIEASSDGFH